MDKKLLILFTIIFSFILIIRCEEEEEEEEDDDNEIPYDFLEGEKYFKKNLKDYLIDSELYKSDRIIEREELEMIFIEIISDGDPNSMIAYLGDTLRELTDYFMNLYYKEKKQIRGKDIYKLFDINAISKKLEELLTKDFQDEEEEMDFDKRDEIGKPNSGL